MSIHREDRRRRGVLHQTVFHDNRSYQANFCVYGQREAGGQKHTQKGSISLGSSAWAAFSRGTFAVLTYGLSLVQDAAITVSSGNRSSPELCYKYTDVIVRALDDISPAISAVFVV